MEIIFQQKDGKGNPSEDGELHDVSGEQGPTLTDHHIIYYLME